ncbi:MAG: hypothetical protein AMJ90_04000 [candidate division Zixibacteria bacterium SM23_73_2]|nr:MAG: hypothetical protein AMJ90_04000 [candidate division Zixibacteria bacterium SM23_73_2]
MPELPEVQTIVDALKKSIIGKKIKSVDIDCSRVFSQSKVSFKKGLKGKKIKNIKRRGKFLIIDLTENQTLLIHLGMTGGIFFSNKNQSHKKHDHLIIKFSDKTQIRYHDPRKFGKVIKVTSSNINKIPEITKLGPEPLEISQSEFVDIFENKKGRIKTTLLNQRVLAGLGNIYSDEALFDAKIHPLTKTDRLKEKKLLQLHSSIQKILKNAIKAGGSSIDDYLNIDGEMGLFQFQHKVYGREGEPCKVCGAKIKRIRISQRSSFYCPRCQKLSTPP